MEKTSPQVTKQSRPSTKGYSINSPSPIKKKISLMRRIQLFLKKHSYFISFLVSSIILFSGIYYRLYSPAMIDDFINNPLHIQEIQKYKPYDIRPNPTFQNWTLSDVLKILGGIAFTNLLESIPQCNIKYSIDDSIPSNFDARQKWPSCFHKSYINGNCSSSWATATAEMLTSRYCIENKKNNQNIQFSPQTLLSCSPGANCKIGSLDGALFFAKSQGLVSTKCFPYTATEKPCSMQCKNESPKRVQSFCKVLSEDVLKSEIYRNGPLTTIMLLYDDFLLYGGNGMYEPTQTSVRLSKDGKSSLVHAITILGWGEDEKTLKPYWLVQLNFGPEWGEKGFARVSASPASIFIEYSFAAFFTQLSSDDSSETNSEMSDELFDEALDDFDIEE